MTRRPAAPSSSASVRTSIRVNGVVLYVRRRTTASAWFAATFTVMGAVVVAGRIVGDGELPEVGGKLLASAELRF